MSNEQRMQLNYKRTPRRRFSVVRIGIALAAITAVIGLALLALNAATKELS